jgi:hypothetical protein
MYHTERLQGAFGSQTQRRDKIGQLHAIGAGTQLPGHFCICYILGIIQGVPGGKVSILGGHSIDHL